MKLNTIKKNKPGDSPVNPLKAPCLSQQIKEYYQRKKAHALSN